MSPLDVPGGAAIRSANNDRVPADHRRQHAGWESIVRVMNWMAGLGFLAIGGVAHAESQVPLNYVDDFGSRSPAFTSDGAPATAPSADREWIASVNGPGAAEIAPSAGAITATSPVPSVDRERIASVNGATAPQVGPTVTSGTQAAGTAIARQGHPDSGSM